MVNSSDTNKFQDTFRLNYSYYFDQFGSEKEFFESAQKWINDNYFIIVLGRLHKVDGEQYILLFFNHQYFPVEEVKGHLKEGSCFAFRSDQFKGYSMRNRLKDYGFLAYSIQESIPLMGNDYRLIKNIFELIAQETKMPSSDIHSTILVAYLNLLLQHMQRFYQWSIANRLDECKLLQQNFISELHTFFDRQANSLIALPTLVSLAKKLDHTTQFLNDVSLKISGSTAQHHIDNFIVTIAKELLAETDLSVAEIAKKMHFVEPQSLNRLFKRKAKVTPLDYRISII